MILREVELDLFFLFVILAMESRGGVFGPGGMDRYPFPFLIPNLLLDVVRKLGEILLDV